MRNAVLHQAPPNVFRMRRFTDPVSPLNDDLHDTARSLIHAIELLDHLGIEIMSVEADRTRNRRIQVVPGREVSRLDGVEITRTAQWSHWCANRHGVEIRWCVPVEAA